MEMNKIFAAILLAGIIGMLSGFIAKKIVHPKMPEQDSFIVEVADAGAGNAVAKKPTEPEPIAALLASANIEKGEKLSKACAACHSFTKGGPNRVGPNLWDIVNAKLAHLDDFSYSSKFQEMSAEGKIWTYDDLNFFLWKPKKYAPGTKMSYIGMRKVQDRADIIAWMRSLSDNPAPLPEVIIPEVDVEAVTDAPDSEVESIDAPETPEVEMQEGATE